MAGFEVSFIVLTDGRNIVRFPICQDYKNLSDSERSEYWRYGSSLPTPFLNENMLSKFEEELSVQFCAGSKIWDTCIKVFCIVG